MLSTYVGDLAQSHQLRRDTARIRGDLNRLTNELSSGVTSDISRTLKGNFGPLAGIERGLARSDSFEAIIGEQSLVIATYQNTFSNMRTLGNDIRDALLSFPDSANAVLIKNAGSDALTRLDAALNSLNTQVGGISLFAGTATDASAVTDLETIMTALETEIALASATTASDVETVVNTWFGASGGFETVGYIGGTGMTQGVQVSEGETLPAGLTAETQEIRSFLGALSLAGLLGRGLLAGNLEEQGALARLAGEQLINADNDLVGLQSSVGSIEAQLERATVEVATERHSLELARADLIEIDPFEAAVGLQNAESQLQTLYSITARLSRLSLANFL